jgi:hypothetical protein
MCGSVLRGHGICILQFYALAEMLEACTACRPPSYYCSIAGRSPALLLEATFPGLCTAVHNGDHSQLSTARPAARLASNPRLCNLFLRIRNPQRRECSVWRVVGGNVRATAGTPATESALSTHSCSYDDSLAHVDYSRAKSRKLGNKKYSTYGSYHVWNGGEAFWVFDLNTD